MYPGPMGPPTLIPRRMPAALAVLALTGALAGCGEASSKPTEGTSAGASVKSEEPGEAEAKKREAEAEKRQAVKAAEEKKHDEALLKAASASGPTQSRKSAKGKRGARHRGHAGGTSGSGSSSSSSPTNKSSAPAQAPPEESLPAPAAEPPVRVTSPNQPAGSTAGSIASGGTPKKPGKPPKEHKKHPEHKPKK